MLLNHEHECRFALLTDQPWLATRPTAARIDRLIEARAWNDAALALVELELPRWLRRLVYENGKWHCSLSRHPNLPVALDETATASHEVLPLAILAALVEAHHRMSVTLGISLQVAPGARRRPAMQFVAIISAERLLPWRW
jgi:hypothetical protein